MLTQNAVYCFTKTQYFQHMGLDHGSRTRISHPLSTETMVPNSVKLMAFVNIFQAGFLYQKMYELLLIRLLWCKNKEGTKDKNMRSWLVFKGHWAQLMTSPISLNLRCNVFIQCTSLSVHIRVWKTGVDGLSETLEACFWHWFIILCMCVHLCIIVLSVFIIVYFNIETKIKIDLLIKHTSSNGCSPVWSAVVEHLISLWWEDILLSSQLHSKCFWRDFIAQRCISPKITHPRRTELAQSNIFWV